MPEQKGKPVYIPSSNRRHESTGGPGLDHVGLALLGARAMRRGGANQTPIDVVLTKAEASAEIVPGYATAAEAVPPGPPKHIEVDAEIGLGSGPVEVHSENMLKP